MGGYIARRRSGDVYRMNEEFYQLYKSMKDLVHDFSDKDVSQPFKNLIEGTKRGCDILDEKDKRYLYRWMNERFLLFRFHKGGLTESMETVTIIDNCEQLLLLVMAYWEMPFTKLTIEPYVYDNRIQWDTQFVLVHEGDKHYPVGYLNKKPDWSIEDYEQKT